MADFSDSEDEREIQNILSQAMDHSVLEQVAAINCSAFDSDSILPTHLETRFHKLKSFPSTKPTSQISKTHKNFASSSFNSQIPPNEFKNRVDTEHDSGSQSDDSNAPPKENPVGKMGLELKSPSGSFSSPPKLSSFAEENKIFSAAKQGKTKKKMGLKSKSRSGSFPIGEKDLEPKSPSGGFCYSPSNLSGFSHENKIFSAAKQEKMGVKPKSRSGHFGSPSDSSNSSTESRSPPQRIGCFWCSPKRVSGKKSKENRNSGIDHLNWGNDDELLSDLSTFDSREQEKILKKAMKEEEKINREAEKIVKWAKQVSMRMEVSGIEDELSDGDSTK